VAQWPKAFVQEEEEEEEEEEEAVIRLHGSDVKELAVVVSKQRDYDHGQPTSPAPAALHAAAAAPGTAAAAASGTATAVAPGTAAAASSGTAAAAAVASATAAANAISMAREPSYTASSTLDERLALQMQARFDEEEREAVARRRGREEATMWRTPDGRALLFCQDVLALSIPSADQADGTRFVAKDDMVAMATKMIKLQQQFRAEGKPTEVTIAWHYTRQTLLEGIRENGLMTRTELRERGIHVSLHGATFGPGVYTANNPHHFRSFGDTCLLLAVLRGREMRVTSSKPPDHGADTVIGNKQQLYYFARAHRSTLSAAVQHRQPAVGRQTPHGVGGGGGGTHPSTLSAAAQYCHPAVERMERQTPHGVAGGEDGTHSSTLSASAQYCHPAVERQTAHGVIGGAGSTHPSTLSAAAQDSQRKVERQTPRGVAGGAGGTHSSALSAAARYCHYAAERQTPHGITGGGGGTHPSTLSAAAQYCHPAVERQTRYGVAGGGGGRKRTSAADIASASAAAYHGVPTFPATLGAAGAALPTFPALGHDMVPHKADEIVLQRSDQVVPVFVVANPTGDCWCAIALQQLIYQYFNS